MFSYYDIDTEKLESDLTAAEATINLAKPRVLTHSPERATWISVEEYLPAMFEDVIVRGEYAQSPPRKRAIQARRFTYGDGVWSWLTVTDAELRNVSHWIPLPLFPANE